MTKRCISCGMPLSTAGDFPLGDTSKDFCVHCAHPDGTMKSYEEVLAGMTQFIMQHDGLNEIDARSAAKGVMASMPAWHKVPGC